MAQNNTQYKKTVSGSGNSRKKLIISTAITATIILALVFLPISQAVQVTITPDKIEYTKQPTTFTVSVIIEAEEMLPVSNLTLNLANDGSFDKTSVFSLDGTPIENCDNLVITPLPVDPEYFGSAYGVGYGYQDYGYGYRYGYDPSVETGYGFNYGYGYGYQTVYPTQLKYEIQWSFEDDSAPVGAYTATLGVNCIGGGVTHSYYGSASFAINRIPVIGPGTDTTPPEITLNEYTPDPTNDTTPTYTGTATDTNTYVVQIQYRIDNGTWTDIAQFVPELSVDFTFTTPPLEDGTHTIDVQAKDAYDNVAMASDTLTIVSPVPDFSVSVSPSSGTAVQGESTTATVSVSPIAGFDDSVSLSVSGLPSGASATFSAVSGTPSFTSTLTISVAETTPAGTYTITVRGTGNGTTHSDTYSLTVADSTIPDFSVSVSPSSGTAVQGESTTATVSVSPIAGFDDSVSLSVSGLPSGASATFSAVSGTPSFTSTLTISVAETTPAGTYTITITGTGNGNTHSSTYSLTVQTGGVVPPADFEVSDLSISPDQVKPDEVVTVSMTVTNTGEQTGSYTVEFKVDGLVEDTQTVTLDPDQSTNVQFTTSKTEEGTYTVDVDGLTGTFTVKAPSEVSPLPIVVVVIVVGVAAVLILYFRDFIIVGIQKLLNR
ncbi:MAG: Ig-like domain-containing protein [archaeon]